MSWQLFLRRAPPPPQRHQLMRRLLTLHQPHRSNETISRTAAAHVRRASVQSAPTPPPAPTAPRAPTPAAPSQPLRDTESGAAGIELYDSSFASAFERAVEEVVSAKCDERLQGKPGPSSNSSPQLSPWLQYLVGLRSEPPRRTHLSNNNSASQMADERRTRFFSSDTSNDAWAADNVFFHHIFDNAKDATLYVTVRQPREFLKPDVTARESSVEAPKTSDYASKVKSEWSLAPFGGLLQRLERVLREMLQGELAKSHNNDVRNMSGGVWSADFVLTFWRAMLEQAFLEQYCEVEALNTAAAGGNDKGDGGGGGNNVESCRVLDREKCGGQKAPRTVFDLYPYDYRGQPAELRRRLEACLRALLCASAFTLHAQWEQFMVRHGPNDTVAHVLGLEVILLWWYANPDQVPVELTSSVHRLPPPTLRQQARLAEGAGGGGNDAGTLNHSALWRSSMAAAGNVATVEEHLREYMAALEKHTGHLVDASDRNTDAESPARARTRCSAGGFLCPAAVFPPSYRDALRAHLRQVRHHGDLVTCPLFPRVLEVAVMTASTAPESWSNTTATVIERGAIQDEALAGLQTEKTTNLSCAARRGREIAEQLTVDWLWPVMCTTNNSDRPPPLSSSSSSSSSAFDGRPLPSASAGESSPVDASLSMSSLSDSATERVDDWAVLVATVTAIAQVRGHMPALRRGNDSRRRAKPAGWSSNGASEEGGAAGEETVAYVRDELYVPAMRVLLGMSAQKRILERNGSKASEASAQKHSLSVDATADLPSWIFLIFAHVVFCFQDCGWLRRSAVHQPATPAHLWCQLYQTLCTAFPHVFAAGKTVTVLWTHLALEGAAAAPSTYHSTFQPFSIGRTEAMQSWIGLLAQSQAGRPLSSKELWQRWSERLEKAHDAEFRNVEGGGVLSPRSELRERSAFVANAASCDLEPQRVDFTPGTASEKSLDDVTDQPPLHRPSHHNKLAHEGPLSQHASFASPRPAVAPPMHLHSDAVRGQMRDYLACCTELREEVTSVQVQIFRHYATLPIIVRQETCGGEHGVALATTASLSVGDIAPDEAARLRRMGRPSFFVLLKLLHSVAAFGDTFVALDDGVTTATTDAASPSVSGLVPSVMRDALAVCHPVVATYLRRVLVHSTTASGRSGALALLFNETLQSHLNGLPPLLGRRRLVTALLWSGLHPSVLAATPPDVQQQQQQKQQEQRQVEEEEEDKTVAFGSGSLAWHVLGSNQQRFFSTLPTLPAPDAGSGGSATQANSSGEDSDTAEAMAEPPSTNTPADVSGLVEDVVRHLWQLAVAVPEPARGALHLCPHVCASTDVLNIGSTERAATKEEDQGDDASDTQTQGTPSAASDDDAKGENSFHTGTSADLGMEGVSDNLNIDLDNSDDEGASYDAFADWTPAATDEAEENAEDVSHFVRHTGIDDDATPMENALGEDESDCEEGGVTRWSAQETLQRAVVDGPAGLEEDSEDHPGQKVKNLDQQRASAQKALVATLQSALPASQHLFHSLLEVLAWVANAQQSHEALPTFTELSSGSEMSGLLRVGSVDWCAELATYYRLCASAWSARVVEAPPTAREPASNEGHATTAIIITTKAVDDSVLCRPKLMEQVFLVVSQTCPDVYLLSLLLLNMAVRGTRGPLSSRAVRATLLSRWQRALPLFPSSVECAVAQLLYHAGVSATTVRSWHRDTAAAAGDEQFLESEAIFKLVTMHVELLSSLSANAAHEEGATSLTSHVATQHDLLLSMGSLLLASLQRRLHSTSRRPSFFSYNFYLNEFLHFSTSPDTDEMSTRKNAPVGVVLPSLQLKSSTPLLRVPQQTTPLRSTWHDGLTATQRAVLRRCCRGDDDKRTSAPRHVKDRANRQKQTVNSVTVAMTASTPQDDIDNYVAAFL